MAQPSLLATVVLPDERVASQSFLRKPTISFYKRQNFLTSLKLSTLKCLERAANEEGPGRNNSNFRGFGHVTHHTVFTVGEWGF